MAENYTFQAEIQQVLQILIYSLYKDRDIFLRELISNASDALNRAQFEILTTRDVQDPDLPLEINITVNEEDKTITISDTGVGMTAEEMVDSLGVIARSGAKAFIEKVRESDGGEVGKDIIGQFGVGFYSVFMVAERVEVISRSIDPNAPAMRWESDGQEGYTIQDAERATRGTDIIVHLREDAQDFATVWRVRDIINRHSKFVSFPIYVHKANEEEPEEDPQPVNETKAIWRRNEEDITDEEYTQFYRTLTMDFNEPAMRIHSFVDVPLQFYTLLYIPASAERNMFSPRTEPGLKLYTRKILIDEYTTDLLPEYLRFVEGVVDSEDLPLNVSRETVQDNPLVEKLKKIVTREVLTSLKQLSKDDPEKYANFWDEFGIYLKQGIITEPGDRNRLEPLLRFESDTSNGELISLKDYIANLAENQEDIYYVMADTTTAAARSPHLEAFRARGIDVLYLTDTVDGFLMPALREVDGHSFVAVDAADLELDGVGTTPEEDVDNPPIEAEQMADLIVFMKGALGAQVEDVRESKVLAGSTAARLVAPEGSLDRHQQRLYQMLEQEYDIPNYILEVNPRHPIVANLTARLEENADDPYLQKAAEVLYQNALLAEGIHPDPSALASTIQDLLEKATR